jgi:predicted TIM-barrel fold metal-dependent hydrolase
MTTLRLPDIERYLALAAEVGRGSPVVDVHVHATEVIFGGIHYRDDAGAGELLSAADRPFESPRALPFQLGEEPAVTARFDATARLRASRLFFGRAYEQTGRSVLLAHMDLAEVDVALLLPVAPSAGTLAGQMSTLLAVRGQEPRLLVAYSVPATVPLAEIALDVETAARAYDARAVKLHPNLSRIDLGTPAGIERAERVVEACGRARLPLVVHGGRSPILGDDPACEHATLDRLAQIDWGRSQASVILAHAGLFGYGAAEAVAGAVSKLERLLARHGNLRVDLSGLEFELLRALLRRIDHERIVFGSDALYFPMWQAVVRLLHALGLEGFDAGAAFARIACRNGAAALGLAAGTPE